MTSRLVSSVSSFEFVIGLKDLQELSVGPGPTVEQAVSRKGDNRIALLLSNCGVCIGSAFDLGALLGGTLGLLMKTKTPHQQKNATSPGCPAANGR